MCLYLIKYNIHIVKPVRVITTDTGEPKNYMAKKSSKSTCTYFSLSLQRG